MKQTHGSRRRSRMICGIVLASAGVLLLGVKLGWIPEEVFREIPFIPLALIFFGALLVYSSAAGRRKDGESGERIGHCC